MEVSYVQFFQFKNVKYTLRECLKQQHEMYVSSERNINYLHRVLEIQNLRCVEKDGRMQE